MHSFIEAIILGSFLKWFECFQNFYTSHLNVRLLLLRFYDLRLYPFFPKVNFNYTGHIQIENTSFHHKHRKENQHGMDSLFVNFGKSISFYLLSLPAFHIWLEGFIIFSTSFKIFFTSWWSSVHSAVRFIYIFLLSPWTDGHCFLILDQSFVKVWSFLLAICLWFSSQYWRSALESSTAILFTIFRTSMQHQNLLQCHLIRIFIKSGISSSNFYRNLLLSALTRHILILECSVAFP